MMLTRHTHTQERKEKKKKSRKKKKGRVTRISAPGKDEGRLRGKRKVRVNVDFLIIEDLRICGFVGESVGFEHMEKGYPSAISRSPIVAKLLYTIVQNLTMWTLRRKNDGMTHDYMNAVA